MNDNNNRNQKSSFSLPIGMWLPVGLCLGVALGSAFNSSEDSEDSGPDKEE